MFNTTLRILSAYFIMSSVGPINDASAQISIEGIPASTTYNLPFDYVPIQTMPNVDVTALLEEDRLNEDQHKPQRFAKPFAVRISLLDEGIEEYLPDGGRVVRLRINCPSAKNINLLYSDFYIPVGASYYIYNLDKSEILGAFASHNNREDREFATAIIDGDDIILEYYEPQYVKGKANIVISQIGHGYRGFDGVEEDLGDSGSCQVDINCPEGNLWQDEKRGIARMTLNGQDWCSGSLVRTTSAACTPYFLSAHHCLGPYDALTNPNASGFVFYFNWEYAGCNVGGTSAIQTISGAQIVANDAPSDFALLMLDADPIAADYNVYFNGWDARPQEPGVGGVGIHHPSGDAKKISTHSYQPIYDDWFGTSPATSHLELFWEATANGYAVTEGGSSGSPLFDMNSRVLGQLHGGSGINCSDPALDIGIYGHIAYSWENAGATNNARKLKPWLDPGNTGILVTDGSYMPTCLNLQCGGPDTVVVNSAPLMNMTYQSNIHMHVLGPVNVENNLSVNFNSGWEVFLDPTLEVQLGSSMSVSIDCPE